MYHITKKFRDFCLASKILVLQGRLLICSNYLKRKMFRGEKVSRIACTFVFRRKSFAVLLLTVYNLAI